MKTKRELHERIEAQVQEYRKQRGPARVESGVEIHGWIEDGTVTESSSWHRHGDTLTSEHDGYHLAIRVRAGHLEVYAAKATSEPRQMVVDSLPDPVNTMLHWIACMFVWQVHRTDKGQNVFVWVVSPSPGYERRFSERLAILGLSGQR